MRFKKTGLLSLAALAACGVETAGSTGARVSDTTLSAPASGAGSVQATDPVATMATTATTLQPNDPASSSSVAVAVTLASDVPSSTIAVVFTPGFLQLPPREPDRDPLERQFGDLSGVLVIHEGCVSVDDGGETPRTIVWPYGATFDGSVVTTERGRYEVGDNIVLGGGEASTAAGIVHPDQSEDAERCALATGRPLWQAQAG